MKEENLLYENGYGGVREDGKEYIIRTSERTTPLPWSHVIANEQFGTIVTANGGGYVWYGNSQSNKITCWSNDPIQDPPSEKLVLRWRKCMALDMPNLFMRMKKSKWKHFFMCHCMKRKKCMRFISWTKVKGNSCIVTIFLLLVWNIRWYQCWV